MCEEVVESLEMLCELECRVDLRQCQRFGSVFGECTRLGQRTSASSTSGGPSVISSAFVPGRMRRDAPLSSELKSFCCSSLAGSGESWSSAIGGGLGRRGELEGEGAEAIVGAERRKKLERRETSGFVVFVVDCGRWLCCLELAVVDRAPG